MERIAERLKGTRIEKLQAPVPKVAGVARVLHPKESSSYFADAGASVKTVPHVTL